MWAAFCFLANLAIWILSAAMPVGIVWHLSSDLPLRAAAILAQLLLLAFTWRIARGYERETMLDVMTKD